MGIKFLQNSLKFLQFVALIVLFAQCTDDKSTTIKNGKNEVDRSMNVMDPADQATFSENIFETNTIGVLDDQGVFHRASEQEMINYWMSIFELDSTSVTFGDFYITEANDLKVRSSGGTITIATKMSVENGLHLLSNESCMCQTTDCPSSGCEPSINASECSCSPCSGKCTKTATIVMAPAPYFVAPG